ncbi:MAG: DUF488 domain-containing protein [Niabella sp.]
MNKPGKHIIYTIGHSTHPLPEFLEMLHAFNIKVLVDIRSLPGSRKFPQFDQENLKISLEENGIQYLHLAGLGGRRKVKKDSRNERWKHDSFRGYADYMESSDFKKAVAELEHIAVKQPTVYMCSEAVWWRCHRSMVSDYLKVKGWTVLHIMETGKVQEHPYTAPARIVNGNVCYYNENLFDQ